MKKKKEKDLWPKRQFTVIFVIVLIVVSGRKALVDGPNDGKPSFGPCGVVVVTYVDPRHGRPPHQQTWGQL